MQKELAIDVNHVVVSALFLTEIKRDPRAAFFSALVLVNVGHGKFAKTIQLKVVTGSALVVKGNTKYANKKAVIYGQLTTDLSGVIIVARTITIIDDLVPYGVPDVQELQAVEPSVDF